MWEALVHKRAGIFDHLAPFRHVAATNPGQFDQGRAQLAKFLRLEVERVFARELDGVPRETLEAIDAITSFEMQDRLRRDQKLGRSRAEAVVVGAIRRLVGKGYGGPRGRGVESAESTGPRKGGRELGRFADVDPMVRLSRVAEVRTLSPSRNRTAEATSPNFASLRRV